MGRKLCSASLLIAIALLSVGQARGDAGATPQDREKQKGSAEDAAPAAANKRLTIEVTGGEKDVAVANASVYLKFSEGRTLRKDRKYELNVKTNRDGTAHIPDPPLGKVLLQVVADGWKTYGKYYELTDAGGVIKIHLDRPPKWY